MPFSPCATHGMPRRWRSLQRALPTGGRAPEGVKKRRKTSPPSSSDLVLRCHRRADRVDHHFVLRIEPEGDFSHIFSARLFLDCRHGVV